MGSMSGQKISGAAAILFIIMTLVSGFMVSPPPSPNESAAKFLEYYSDNRNALLAQGIIALLSNIPAFLFIAGLWNILRADDRHGDVLANGSLFAFITAGAIASVASVVSMGLAMSADGNGLTEESARTIGLVFVLANPAIFSSMAAATGFSGLIIARGTRLPTWIGWIGLLNGLVLLVATFSVAMSGAFEPYGLVGFAGFMLLAIYAVVLGVFMWLRAPDNG